MRISERKMISALVARLGTLVLNSKGFFFHPTFCLRHAYGEPVGPDVGVGSRG
ncbi:hypothetical protein BDB13_0366 [Rhodococcus sp. OK302]|nr:hypothetical protein BDB13_0366 [Rhodococcus sp. OK302]